ncbi:hypothetical protein FRACYDRAFT_237245 [Fragilariopsis cylindrus CCMP1102]|uniref:Uncharacterized protein n=1 Tax=Fragilariopsis cylindrus CCMP1102 TaxID=635003 RepID=A0A1E7FLE6_9STRA|nr:hypothetical protein FRACYDRAFT_237245 [Fragilariopsis cylindrus CCMP1102]|eukprot:OEU18957.1 hypothetical protein FRACYDRAFT_237245 [Fragilariopsis cylindrus CCMP1102]
MNEDKDKEQSIADLPVETTTASNDLRRRQQAYDYTKSVLLGQQVKTTLSDGRNLTGKLICIDRLKNMILTFVKEERLIDPSDYKYRVNDHDDDNVNDNDDNSVPDDGILRKKKVVRFISQAMIPGSQLVKVEIAKSKLKEDSDGVASWGKNMK